MTLPLPSVVSLHLIRATIFLNLKKIVDIIFCWYMLFYADLEKGDLMAMFLGHIAFILQVLALATGLVLVQLGKENKELSSLAGWILVIFGILGAICTSYYMIQYFYLGDFAHAYPQMMMHGKPS